MTEEEARAWLAENFGATAVHLLERFVALVRDEARRQNLIAPSTLDQIWSRHVVDSAQLIPFARDQTGTWLDVGSGGGFPGLVVALLREETVVLSEPRKLRAEFLQRCAERLGITGRVQVEQRRIEQMNTKAAAISARAVSSLATLLQQTAHCSTDETVWLLPRGRSACQELTNLGPNAAMFHVEQSLTDPSAGIVVGQGRPQ